MRTSCCQPSLALSLSDLAGNSVICTAGPLLSRAGQTHSSLVIIIMLVLITNIVVSTVGTL